MSRTAKVFCASLALLTSLPAMAEVVLSQSPEQFEVDMLAMGINPPPGFKPSADLTVMLSKAGGNPESRQILQMIMQISRPGRGVESLRQQVFGRMAEMGLNTLSKPFHYAIFDQVQDARQRAQVWGQMLAADLNNDGQITKQELKDTLEFMPSEGVSDAFFTSDANDDNVLSPDELRAAVEARSQNRRYGRGSNGIARMFDFDDDGYLTAAEFDRGAVALGYVVP